MSNKKKSGSKSNKILIGLIIALFAVIIVLAVLIIKGNKEDDKTGTTTKETTEDVATKTDATEEKEESSEDSKFLCEVKVNNSNSWESDGKYCAQLDSTIINNSASDISNWEIRMDADGVTVDSFWNCEAVIKDGYISITSVDYNATVVANSSTKDIGVILKLDSESLVSSVMNSAVLYVDGKLYSEKAEPESDEKEDKENKEDKEDKKEEGSSKKESGTPFANHGKLKVSGTDLVDSKGKKFQLKGVSTHGIAWFPDYVNKEAFQYFRDDWGANLIRLAMYTDENGGYCSGGDRENLKKLIDDGVKYADELGMYVIIDWHILHDLTPQKYKEDAKEFFDEMSSKYSGYDNVIYEICNEPNGGTSWEEVKSYAEEIIPVIRKNAPDAIIIIGTPNWSQDVDIASKNPVQGYDNLMYAVHFYAATHTDSIRDKVKTAVSNGLPVFVSEFSICDASGNGANDYAQADKWFELIDDLNLSYAGWSVSNKDETSALIKSSCNKTSGWTDDELSETGVWLKNQIKNDN